ncbi:MAG: DNA alkylation repair protein [Pseudobdellovibrionaceae bacterium]
MKTAAKSLTAVQARKRLREFSSQKNLAAAKWFFKTDDGCYSEHDRFIGVKVPNTRVVAKEFHSLNLTQIKSLLQSKIHEERLLALIILVQRAKKAEPTELKELTDFYLANLKHVNNWDLVDVSAEPLLGAFLFTQPPARALTLLSKFARSSDLWYRRVSIIATFYFIRRNSFAITLKIADLLLNDDQDLIHKAVGWMLREAGNRDIGLEQKFLKTRYRKMPRTMLRYAIEKFPEKTRQAYLKGIV